MNILSVNWRFLFWFIFVFVAMMNGDLIMDFYFFFEVVDFLSEPVTYSEYSSEIRHNGWPNGRIRCVSSSEIKYTVLCIWEKVWNVTFIVEIGVSHTIARKAIFCVNLTILKIHISLIWQLTTNVIAFMLVYSVLEIHFISRLIHLAHAIFMQRQRKHYNQQLCSTSCGMCRARKITNWICDYELFKKRVKCQE